MRIALAFMAALAAGGVNAQEGRLYLGKEPIGSVAGKGGQLQFEIKLDMKDAVVSITGPNGYRAHQTKGFERNSIDLRQFGSLVDGIYQFEIATIGQTQVELASPPLNNGRGDKERRKRVDKLSVAGSFRVLKGEIILVSGGKDIGGDKDEG